jgi:tetratricopeptide (TPR) repeat protein
MKVLLSVALVLLCVSILSAQKKKLDPFQYVKQDSSTATTPVQLSALGAAFKVKAYALLQGKEKQDLDKELKRLDISDSIKRRAAAYELSSAAMVLMGASQSKNTAIVLAAAPVALLPGEPLLVSNFCSLLRMMDSITLSLPTLVYAKNLSPNYPVILTNLGNTLLELGDDRKAEVFFKRALRIDPHFRDARSSLVDVYLKRKDLGSAYEELLKGVEEVTYSEGTKMAFERASNDGARQQQTQSSSQTPPPPAGSGASPTGGGGKTPDKLVLPPFPDWSDLKAFMNASGPGAWQKEVQNGLGESMKALSDVAQKIAGKYTAISKLPSDQQMKAMHAIQSAPFTKMAKRNDFAMEVMQQYIDDRYDRIIKDYKEKEEKDGEKFNKSFTAYSDAFGKQADALGKAMQAEGPEGLKELPAYQKLMIEYCKQTKRLQEDHFQDWKKNARVWHNKTNDLLQEYWVYCEQYLDQVYGDDYEQLQAKRMMYVYGKLAILAGTYAIMPLSFMAAFTTSSGDCAEPTPIPVAAGEADMTTTVPKQSGPPCPWDNGGKLKIGAGPCSLGLDCESIECECLAGVGGAAKWNFKNKTTTLTPEVGVKFELGLPGPEVGEMHYKIGEVTAKAGVAITFDKDGQPFSWNDKKNGVKAFGEAGASVGSGPISMAGNVQLNYTAVAGLDSEFTYELAASH